MLPGDHTRNYTTLTDVTLPATRRRVEQAMTSLGYVPNRAAQSLAGKQQCRLALVYSNPSAAYLSELLIGALEQANTSNLQLLIELWAKGSSAPQLVNQLMTRNIDGVLLPPPLCEDPALLSALHAQAIRMVQISPDTPFPFAHAVTINDKEAARKITEHLLALGHRRIGFIEGSPAQSQTPSALMPTWPGRWAAH